MAPPRRTPVVSLVVLLLSAIVVALAPYPAAAQTASAVTITLTPSATKAKIGDIIEFTVRVENVGTGTISGLTVSLGLPDALDARAVDCPFSTVSGITDCLIGDFAAGTLAEVQFYVHVGSRTPNGPVTAQVSDSTFTTLASTAIAPIKIIGPPRRR